ncbi:hypothetical protein [Paenibacillus prosopidis]|uniref:Uncharacterized protein n=1 Tax=Paenibacillus prosopidis TaxID=630520 RepID=A0A368VXI2_9BACL|nr:hypothetical protein [Paenibacillus prosopidis]RCW44262.1 hypothetical protein DFP97_112126 [Paenibacillus prosopidis]
MISGWKASELRSELIDARELDTWLRNSGDEIIIDINFCMVDTSHAGVLPQCLIIYKEA